MRRRTTRRPRFKKLFLAINEGVYIVRGELDAVAVGDGVGGAGLNAIAAEDAARIVDVVHLGVALAGGDSLRFGVFGGFDIDAIGRTRGSTQEAAHALLKSVLVALKNMDAAITRLHTGWNVRIALRGGLPEHRPQRDAEAFEQGDEGFTDFPNDGWHRAPL